MAVEGPAAAGPGLGLRNVHQAAASLLACLPAHLRTRVLPAAPRASPSACAAAPVCCVVQVMEERRDILSKLQMVNIPDRMMALQSVISETLKARPRCACAVCHARAWLGRVLAGRRGRS